MKMLLKIIIPLLLLSGCNFADKKHKLSKSDTDTYNNTVNISEKTHMLTTRKINDVDEKDLKKLAESFKKLGVQKIILTPIIKKSERIDNYIILVEATKNVLIKNNIPESRIEVAAPENGVGKKTGIRINSYTYDLKLPTAKEWKYNIGDIDVTKDMPNYAVSTEYNLGQMIANPRDLVDPAEMPGTEAKSEVISVRKVMPVAGIVAGTGIGTTTTTGNNSSVTTSSIR